MCGGERPGPDRYARDGHRRDPSGSQSEPNGLFRTRSIRIFSGISRPNIHTTSGVDISYIRMPHGWMYLVAIIDWHSRYVVSWALDQTLEMPFVLDCVDRAFETALPDIFNSDDLWISPYSISNLCKVLCRLNPCFHRLSPFQYRIAISGMRKRKFVTHCDVKK